MTSPFLLAAVAATAVSAGAVTAAPMTFEAPSAPVHTVPTRDLGPCWAQAGRVVGGGIGVLSSSVIAPWAFPGILAAYLGSMSQEQYTSDGHFSC